jgi:hypothetical protein
MTNQMQALGANYEVDYKAARVPSPLDCLRTELAVRHILICERGCGS